MSQFNTQYSKIKGYQYYGEREKILILFQDLVHSWGSVRVSRREGYCYGSWVFVFFSAVLR
jgi:hypothetical protein